MWFKTLLAALVEAIRQTWPSLRAYMAGLATAKGIELYHDNKSLKNALDASKRISDMRERVGGLSDDEIRDAARKLGVFRVEKKPDNGK